MAKQLHKKIKQVYKNHGLKGVLNKTKSTARYRAKLISRKFGLRLSLEKRALIDEYYFVSNAMFQITNQDIVSSKIISNGPKPQSVNSAVWFVPHFEHFAYGGIQTIFRFIEKLSIEGVKNIIVIYDNPALDKSHIQNQIIEYFPALKNFEIVIFDDDKLAGVRALPATDIAFCTMWVSAYLLLKYNKTKQKYYFIQDFEPLFYVAGSTYALAESTYRFGFTGIVNTPGLLKAIYERHGLKGISFMPAVNRELYYPNVKKNNKRVRIFFYARPGNPRNAFNLGVETIKQLKFKYGKKIEIITAGAEWDESDYGLQGKITNLGLIKSIDKVAELYRNCDVGFSFMLNKHPSYQMLEYAASGVATVINYNEDHLWLYKDEKNCLLSEPSPLAMTEKVSLLIEDPDLRIKLVNEAQKNLLSNWHDQTELIWQYISGK